MLFTQRNLQRAEDKLVGLDILKSEFWVTEEGSMLIEANPQDYGLFYTS